MIGMNMTNYTRQELTELDLCLLKKAVSKIISDESYGDYTVIEELFQFLDNPTLRLTGFIEGDINATG